MQAGMRAPIAHHASAEGLHHRAAATSDPEQPPRHGGSGGAPPSAGGTAGAPAGGVTGATRAGQPHQGAAGQGSAPPMAGKLGGEGKGGGGAEGKAAEGSGEHGEHGFTCHVCLECPRQPVATVCGHIYCWSCLYKWLNMHRDDPACPVCKAGIEMPNDDPTKAKVIPLYVSGRSEADPRTTVQEESPPRPPTERPPPQRFPNFQGGMPGFGAFNGHVSVSAGLGLLPSLIGLTFVPAHFQQPNGVPGGPPGTGEAVPNPDGAMGSQEEVAQQEFLSRILFMIGTFIALCLIFFP